MLLSHQRCCALAGLALLVAALPAHGEDSGVGVVRVRTVGADGSIKFGSGVVTAPDQVATACHVTRGAATIEIEQGVRRWAVDSQAGSQPHDLCVLTAPGADLQPVRLRRTGELRPLDNVIAVGYEGGGDLMAHRGIVAGLYPYGDGFVIRTTASFGFGASGGALFDDAGFLVGILAFKARTGENLRFALPSEWISPSSEVARSFERIGRASMVRAFWERPPGDRPEFLGLALREATAHAESR